MNWWVYAVLLIRATTILMILCHLVTEAVILDGRKPNLVVNLFAKEGLVRRFYRWYSSDDNQQLAHWQQRIASSVVILQANQL